MKKVWLKVALIFVLLFSVQEIFAQNGDSQFDCFTVLVGKNATQDGSVLLAHNEDDGGVNLVDWYKVPRLTHKKGEFIQLKAGYKLPQVKETSALLWLEMPGQQFSDSYMNEWGIVITSNSCPSREKEPELVNGGIGYFLRRIMAERGKTAKSAIKVAGKIIEQVGYSGSGRTYSVADANEVWMLSVVRGKHWVARRIPDDEVAIMPNYYTIETVDLQDTLNYLGSQDLIQYAIQKGWYDPASGKKFNFRLAYASRGSLSHLANIARKWQAYNLLSGEAHPFYGYFPFSFKAAVKLTAQKLMAVLQNHYEGTELEMNPAYNAGNPHKSIIMRICSQTNQYGFVTQLRNWMPTDIGVVMWLAPRRPCTHPFTPWYCGITQVTQEFTRGDYEKALQNHFNAPKTIFERSSSHGFWNFAHDAENIDKSYGALIPTVRNKKQAMEKRLFSKQETFEKKALATYKKNRKKARQMLTEYTKKYALEALSVVKNRNDNR